METGKPSMWFPNLFVRRLYMNEDKIGEQQTDLTSLTQLQPKNGLLDELTIF